MKKRVTITIDKLIDWCDQTLEVNAFNDVSNNGLQLGQRKASVSRVAFAVDASVAAIRRASALGAKLLVVHHGISWGGGIRRITGGMYEVVKAAMESDVAVAAYHLPLDAHPRYGNNAQLAKYFGLKRVEQAFSWQGNVIGVTGQLPSGKKVGIVSGGAGEFAEEAAQLGCAVLLTGEANWGEIIKAENANAKLLCAGHYETETFGVKALAKAMSRALKVETVFIDRLDTKPIAPNLLEGW